jgi:phage terminase large subunit
MTDLTKLIAPSFYNVHKSIKKGEYSDYWLKGGRASAKSSFISIEIILGLLKDPLSHAVCFRKVGNRLETSVYNQVRWAIRKLGLSVYFKCYRSPLKIEYLPTGQLILFFGLDDPDNSKSIKTDFGYIRYLWFEELSQYDGMEEIRNVKQSVIRGGDGCLTFASYNPPIEPNNWVNAEAKTANFQRLVHHSTYLTVPEQWLGQSFILEAEHLKKVNERAYRHEYLGEEVGTGLSVFTNIVSRVLSAEEIKKFDIICEGIDWGYSVDPFVWGKIYYDRKHRQIYIFDEIYQVGLSNHEAINLVQQKHERSAEIIADSAEPKSIDEFEDAGLAIHGAQKGAGSIRFGIKKLQGLESIVIDPIRCPNILREFIGYHYEVDKTGQPKATYPDKDNHSIDMVRYALEEQFEY